MCGIFGSVSNNNVVTSLIDGLYSLEYRGYDSCGLALQDDKIKIYKAIGEVKNLSNKINKNINSNCGIAHTRWATHGGCTINNCHPHFSYNKKSPDSHPITRSVVLLIIHPIVLIQLKNLKFPYSQYPKVLYHQYLFVLKN